MVLIAALLVVATCALVVLARLAFLLLGRRQPPKPRKACHVAVFLGSGGHTTEMLQLVRALPKERYAERTYVVSRGDRFSIQKAQEAEGSRVVDVIELPRARRVHQTWLSTPLSTLLSLYSCLRWIGLTRKRAPSDAAIHPKVDVILMNGPGTCVPIVAATWIMKLLGRDAPRLIYIESFARVKSLSLTAKLVRRFVDCFVVQWPDALVKGAQYRGWLV